MSFSGIGFGLESVFNLGNNASQFQMIPGATVEGEGKDGDVVDGLRLDEGHGNAFGDSIEVGLEFLIEFDQAFFDILAHLETDNDQALTGL